jgi:cytochrome c biogenesis protein CcdA
MRPPTAECPLCGAAPRRLRAAHPDRARLFRETVFFLLGFGVVAGLFGLIMLGLPAAMSRGQLTRTGGLAVALLALGFGELACAVALAVTRDLRAAGVGTLGGLLAGLTAYALFWDEPCCLPGLGWLPFFIAPALLARKTWRLWRL